MIIEDITSYGFCLKYDPCGIARYVDGWQENHPTLSPFEPGISLIVWRSAGGAIIRGHSTEYHYQHPALATLVDNFNSGEEFRKMASEAFEREVYRFQNGKNLVAKLKYPVLQSIATLVAGEGEP